MRMFMPALVSLALMLSILPAAVSAQEDPRFFPQTNYRIDNDRFWEFFNSRGGVDTFGYPVSRTIRLQGFTVQFFQRAIMQIGEDGNARLLNLLDAGLMPYNQINTSTFPEPDPAVIAQTPPVFLPDGSPNPSYSADIVSFIQRTAPNSWGGEPVNFYQTFVSTVTCEDAFPAGGCIEGLLPELNLQIWGAPTSEPMSDPRNDKFIYQRFQRGIMHYDADCRCTQGLLLADYLKSIMTGENLPPDLAGQAADSIFFGQYNPAAPGWVARPDQLPQTDLTQAFVQQQAGAAPQPTTDFAYGFQVHLWHFGQDAKGLVMGLAENAGFNWIKHQVEWSAVEVGPGQYDWGELDQIVNSARARGLNVLLSVVHAPDHHRGPGTGLMPANDSSFGAFMQTLAARYRGNVQAYELWNEQNLMRETGPGNVSPSRYLGLLRAGYQGTKAGDPNALALFGALSPTGVNDPGNIMDDRRYLEEIYAINGGEVRNYFDALSAHPSGFSNPPECGPTTPECSLSGGWNNHNSFFAFHRVGEYRDVMLGNGDGHKKIWFTEFGYGSTNLAVPGYEYATSVSEQQQGEFLVRAFQLARNLDYVGGMFVWNLNYQLAVPQTDEKWAFGIVRSDWSPRPAYHMLMDLPKR